MAYTAENIPEIDARIANIRTELDRDNRCAGGFSDRGLDRLVLIRTVVSLGAECADAFDGLMLNGRVILAVKTRKFRIVGRRDWQRYRALEDVISVARTERAA